MIDEKFILENKFNFDNPFDGEDFSMFYNSPDLDSPIGVAGPGDIFFTHGREKSRKTSFVTGAMSGAFTTDPQKSLGFSFNFGPDSNILYFDTEQSKGQFYKLQKKFHENVRMKSNLPNYHAYNLRAYDYSERMEIVERVAEGVIASGQKIGMIVTDQAGDFVKDVNHESSVKKYVNFLLDSAENYSCISAPILHSNRGGIESLGKIGALLDKKATSIWRVEYDADTKLSCAHNSRARNLPVYKPVCFTHNKQGFIEKASEDFQF